MLRYVTTLTVLALVLVVGPGAFAEDGHAHHNHGTDATAPAAAQPAGDPVPYLLATCPVSGAKLGAMGQPARLVHDGREVKFCCDGCFPAFEKDPAKHLKKIDDRLAERQRPIYPLQTCVVSGEALGAMGDAVESVHENRLVRFCCDHCVETFEEDPAKHLAKLDAAAIEQQKADYPLETCVVSGHGLQEMGEPIDVVLAGRLVRLCCAPCQEDLKRSPAKYLTMLESANREDGAVEEGAATQPAGASHDHAH